MRKEKEGAPGYMTFREAAIMFSLMPDTEAAQAIKATVNYFLYGVLPENLSSLAAQVFAVMQADIDRNDERYAKIVARNTENRRKGVERVRKEKALTSGQPLENNTTTKGRQTKTKSINNKPETINYSLTVDTVETVSLVDTEGVQGENAKPPKRTRFVPPTDSEAIAYFEENGSTAREAATFCDYFASKGWNVGKSSMKDWKAAARNWIRRGAEYRKERQPGGGRVYQATDYDAALLRITGREQETV